jgi:predicted DNA-binding transcriptional regulator AlpA
MPQTFPNIRTDRLLRTSEVAEALGLAEKTLRNWISTGKGPKPIRMPNGSVRYHGATVLEWLNAGGDK